MNGLGWESRLAGLGPRARQRTGRVVQRPEEGEAGKHLLESVTKRMATFFLTKDGGGRRRWGGGGTFP